MTVVLYILAAMFSLGCAAATVWLLYTLWQEESPVAAVIAGLIGVPLAVFLVALPFFIIAKRNSPVLATLHKGEWTCTAMHHATTTTYVMSGKVLIPITTSHSVCDEYRRAA